MSFNQTNPFREEPKAIKWYINDIISASDRIGLVHSMDRQNMMNSLSYIHHIRMREKWKKKNTKWLEAWENERKNERNYQFEWEQYLYENNNVKLSSSFWCPPTFGFSLCRHGIFHFTRNGRYYYYHLLLVETENRSIISQWVKEFQCVYIIIHAYLWVFAENFQIDEIDSFVMARDPRKRDCKHWLWPRHLALIFYAHVKYNFV